MILDRRLRRTTYYVAVLGMLTLGLAEMNPVYLGLIALASAAGWHLEKHDSAWQINPRALNGIIVAAMIFAGFDYFFISLGWIVSMAHFLLIVQMAKILLPKTNRDYGQIYLISLMNVAVAAIVAADVLFAITLVLYSAAVVRGLILFHFRRELASSENIYLPSGADTVRPTPSPEMREVVSSRFLWMLTAVVAVAWCFNALFFMFVPRVRAELIHLGPNSFFSRLTGFSESVRLGEIGRVMNNEAPVMHIELYDESNGRVGNRIRGERDLYFRGLTYQYYDGREWQRMGAELDGINVLNPIEDLPDVETGRRSFAPASMVRQVISLECIGSPSLFTLQGVVSILPHQPSLLYPRRNYLDENYVASAVPQREYRYRVSSVPDTTGRLYPPEMLFNGKNGSRDSVVLPAKVRKAYLQIPKDVSGRVKDMARQIVPNPDVLSPGELALRVEQYLKSNYGYTLDLKPNPDCEPVEDFLFNTRKGHCEYFASSMVILLRCLDVPSRLVTGFHGGEWNDVGQWYLVKQSDAHAWVEAWFDRDGWVRFDPTPGVAREERAQALAMGRFGRWMDYLRTTWMNNVVQYDEERRNDILEHTRNASLHVRQSLAAVFGAVKGWFSKSLDVFTDIKRLTTTDGAMIFGGTLIASTALVLTARWLLIKLVRTLRRTLSRSRARRLGRVHVAFYQDLQRVLKQRGFIRAPEQTAMEFAGRVATDMGSMRAHLTELTDAFYRVRFGDERISPDEERRLRVMIEEFRKAPVCRE